MRTVEELIESENVADEILEKIETISAHVVENVNLLFKQFTQKVSS